MPPHTIRLLTMVCLVSAASSPVLQSADWGPVRTRLSAAIRHELEAKQIPAFSIALVDGSEIVWEAGFGKPRAASGVAADEHTIYRVGSVSKLFADIAAMQLVEAGKLGLDTPISRYLPELRPIDPFEQPMTLRQLMSHRAGIVREPPVGHYFDPDEPTLEATVLSLNRTAVVYQPQTRTKYSNAGVAVVGLVVERVSGRPFVEYVQENVLKPLGMTETSFVLTPAVREKLAEAVMWGYDGREFAAPTFELGTIPAGNLYSSVHEQAKFLIALHRRGEGESGRLLKAETLESMWVPQFVPADQANFGLGFFVSTFDGTRRIGHAGAVYGFSTQLACLPDEQVGVIAAASRDVVNGTVSRLADYALRLMRAAKAGQPLPEYATSTPLPKGLAREMAGRYASDQQMLEFVDVGERLFVNRGVYRRELRAAADGFVLDDPAGYGPAVKRIDADRLEIEGVSYTRRPYDLPPPPPERWQGLIGEYGWDHNVLFILEERGQLWALIEWCFYYPLIELHPSEFAFPDDYGLYHGERLIFNRDASGRATHVVAASVKFVRRDAPVGRESFKIAPQRPLEELRAEALRAEPPREPATRRGADLVDLKEIEPALKLDVRYATGNNFLGAPVYTAARAFLQRDAAKALQRAHKSLAAEGYGLLIHDAYRPWYVTRIFYDATPPALRRFVADPSRGSRHNRGAAVDLTLYELSTGEAVTMPSGYDEFSPRAYPGYPGGSSRSRSLRELLRRTMERESFRVYEYEWWHFDFADWQDYPLMNLRFEEIKATQE